MAIILTNALYVCVLNWTSDLLRHELKSSACWSGAPKTLSHWLMKYLLLTEGH